MKVRKAINTNIITGSRMIDTKVINAARYMYIGSNINTKNKNYIRG